MRAGGFWRRSAAWSLDALVPCAIALALCHGAMAAASARLAAAWSTLADIVAERMAALILATDIGAPPTAAAMADMLRDLVRDPALHAAADALRPALLALAGPPLAVFVLGFLGWSVGFEASRLRATPGKRALGLRVVASDGGPAGTGALLLRFLAGTLSWLSLNFGHALAALPPHHAALHDRISRTRVVLDDHARARLPGWAGAWLAVIVLASVLACAWLASAMGASLQAALERALWG